METNTNTASKNLVKPIILIVIVLVVLGLLVFFVSKNGNAVAIVNGDPISQTEYNKEYNEALNALRQIENGPELTAETRASLKTEVLNQLIAERLVLQYAEENNITASEEEAGQEYAMAVALIGGEEAFQQYLESFKITEAAFAEDVKNQVIFRKSVESYVEPEKLAVSEEEIRQAYDLLAKQVAESELENQVPPFETVKEWFRTQLKNQKIAEEGKGFLEYLKQQADIEIIT